MHARRSRRGSTSTYVLNITWRHGVWTAKTSSPRLFTGCVKRPGTDETVYAGTV